MKIALGSDHGGFKLKLFLLNKLKSDYELKDFGTFSEQSCDYPDFAEKVGKSVSEGKYDRGILICKSGLGMSMAANKFSNIRAALCRDVESVVSSRKHNDANILVFAANFTDGETALKWTKKWLNTDFEAGRHTCRVEKIKKIEQRLK